MPDPAKYGKRPAKIRQKQKKGQNRNSDLSSFFEVAPQDGLEPPT
ncbi:MAG: hypothetical protein Q3990_02565 [Desulfovibrionaceae bacterium]|nr:hypothetical protein [Desulfovibrionaceae bacterium]